MSDPLSRLARVASALLLALCLGAPAVSQTVTSHGLSTFGDLKYPPDFPHFDYADPDAPKGGTLSFRGTGAAHSFDSLNAFILKGEPAQGLERIYDSLMVRAEDEPDAVYGLIAQSVTYPSDLAWVEFALRPEARFADGSPLTAADVVFTLTTLKEKGSAYYRLALGDVATAEAIASDRVRVTFAPGQGSAGLALEVAQVEILPERYYRTHPFEDSTLDPPLGSGAYEVAKVDAGRSITYCRVKDYWAADLPVNRGRDNFDCVRYEYFSDNTAAFEAFKAGAYLFHEEVTSALWATNYDFPAVRNGWIVREELPDERPSGAQGFWFNLRRPQLGDIRVREAIGLMFNFEWSNATLFYGLYDRTDSFWENTDLEATGVPEGAELALLRDVGASGAVLTEPAVTPAPGGAAQLDRAALRRASGLLDEAGWTVGADGLRRDAGGDLLTLDIVHDNPSLDRVLLPFVDNLRRLGVDAHLVRVDAAQMEQRRNEFDYDMTVARFVLPQTPAAELVTLFGSGSAEAPGSYNLAGLADPVVDALISRVLAARSREDLVPAVHALDRVLRARRIWVPNWYKSTHWLAYWDVFGRPAIKPRYARGENWWWIDPAREARLRSLGALR